MALGIHIKISPPTGIGLIDDAIEPRRKIGRLEQVRIGGSVGEAELEAASFRRANHMRPVVARPRDGIGRPRGARRRYWRVNPLIAINCRIGERA